MKFEEVMKYNLCYVAPLQGEDTKGRALRHKRLHYMIGKHTKREILKNKLKQKMVKHSRPELNEDVQVNRQIKKNNARSSMQY